MSAFGTKPDLVMGNSEGLQVTLSRYPVFYPRRRGWQEPRPYDLIAGRVNGRGFGGGGREDRAAVGGNLGR
jgi:hypothetical protein